LAARDAERMLGRARLAGKVIVDPTNPVGPDGDGGYRKVIGERESSGQILAGLVGAENSRCLGVCAKEA
jgi:predicted dinucleotide-binding enzyme